MQSTRLVRRSSQGIFSVLACALAAVGLPMYGAYKQANAAPASASAAAAAPVRYTITCDGRRIAQRPGKPLHPQAFHWFGGIAACVGVVTELRVRRQLDLVRRGEVAQAIVDEVHHANTRHDRNWMKYGFLAADGRAFHGRCTIGSIDVMTLSTGSRTAVYYDPADPRRNIPEQGLWAVTWEESA
jgi:hypothetical protein